MAITKTSVIGFNFNQIIDTLHPEECFSVSYLGRAEITEEKMMQDEGGGEFIGVKIVDLWIGIDVPEKWGPSHFRKVSVPDTKKPGFYKLVSELETAAIDQHWLPVPVTLPDEIENPFPSYSVIPDNK